MALKLVVESLRDEQPKTTVDKLMEGSRLTIGRTKDNDWTLPFGSISRKHCIVEYRNDTYFITDLNSLNGVHLNGRQLAAQTSHQLHDQDEIRIGGCNIRVYLNKPLSSSSVPKPKPVISDHTEIAQINPQDLPRPDTGIPEGPTMQFGKQPGNRRGQQAEVNTNQPAADLPPPQHESAAAAAKTDSGSAGKPDNADEKPAQSETADTGTRDNGDDWSFLKEFEATDNKPGQSTDSLSELDDLLPSGSRRQTAGPAQATDDVPGATPSSEASAGNTKWPDDETDIGDEADSPEVTGSVSNQAGIPPSVSFSDEEEIPSPVKPARPPYQQQQPMTADSDALLAAFLEGAGVPDLKVDDPQHMMRALGETFRLIVAGMADSLQARRDTKRAIKADDMTQFGAIGNNPLKLADMGVDSIVKLLLMSQGGTYLSMSEAIKEGFENLHSHQLGTMAGMRAALNSLLECFDPQQLEGELSQRSFLESIMPSARKAKYWDAYLQHYDVIAEQAEENFLDLIGDDLREQLAKVTRSKSETD